MTEQQEAFAVAYVCNGGNATQAATDAGYSHPDVMGCRQLQKPHVAARLKQLVALDLTSRLGEFVAALAEIALDGSVEPADRIKALNSLIDRGGLAVAKSQASPIAVQVNVNTTGQQAQSLIKDIWSKRSERLATPFDGTGHDSAPMIEGQVVDA